MTAGTVHNLSSNGVAIPFDRDHFAPLVDTGRADGGAVPVSGDELAARYRRDGYVLLRGLLDPVRLRNVRAAYFSRFDPSYLAPGTTAADGVFSGSRPDLLPAHGTAGHPAHAFVRSAEFLDLCREPALGALAQTLLGGPAAQLPRRILRHFDRSSPAASRAHTDYTYLDAGSDRLVTAWVPIGDCPLATGGLVYLEGSHRLDAAGLRALRSPSDRAADDRPLSHDLASVAERSGRRWLWTDYRCGDVVLHSPHIVHASLDVTTDAMRLSADLRWLADGEQRDERWSTAWAGDDGK
jgi:ectoine hydroxylase-related dioxygenase (phytanoyl-CoA dioxygenase family)